MISDQIKDTLVDQIIKGLIGQGTEGLRPVLELLFNTAMKVEREQFLGAVSHERSEERKGYANGYKPKEVQTRIGALELAVPQVRGLGFYPQSIEKGTRSERALKVAIAQMYLEGVSTRRVQDITEKLCGYEISSTQVSRVTQELDGQFEQFRVTQLFFCKFNLLPLFPPTFIGFLSHGSITDSCLNIAFLLPAPHGFQQSLQSLIEEQIPCSGTSLPLASAA